MKIGPNTPGRRAPIDEILNCPLYVVGPRWEFLSFELELKSRSCVLASRVERRWHRTKSEGDMRLFLATVTLVVWTIPASAQWLDRATPGIPRTPDGKPNLTAPAPRGPNGKIDFSGIWNGPVPETDPDPANAQ